MEAPESRGNSAEGPLRGARRRGWRRTDGEPLCEGMIGRANAIPARAFRA